MIDDKAPNSISEFANADTDPGVALKAFRKGLERELQICFPACVYSYDRYTHMAEVMPLVKAGYFTGNRYEFIRRKPITVAVRQICCGGVVVDFPLYVGDTGWVISSDRDTSLLKQYGALTASALSEERTIKVLEDEYQQVPNQPKIHDFTQGFFIPDNWSRWEYWRYKDAPQAPVGTGIYIGSSFDTKDKYQDGDAYENQTTSSLVINPNGSAVLASSREEDDGDKSALELTGSDAIINITNSKTGNRAKLNLSSEDGIVFRASQIAGKDNEQNLVRDAIFKVNRKEAFFRLSAGTSQYVSLYMKDGNLTLGFTGDLNLMCKGEANVQAGGNSNLIVGGNSVVNIEGASTVNCSHQMEINCGGSYADLSILGNAKVAVGGTAEVDAGSDVNIAAIGDVLIAGGQRVQVESSRGVRVEARAFGGDIDITTVARDSEINIKTEDYDSPINLKAENSAINIASDQELNLSSQKSIIMHSPYISLTADYEAVVFGSKTYIGAHRLFVMNKRTFWNDEYLRGASGETTAQYRARERLEKEEDERIKKEVKKQKEEWEKRKADALRELEKEEMEQAAKEKQSDISGV